MPFKVEEGNILDFKADAIVMPANPEPIIGKGLDKLIYQNAGRNRLLAARKKLGAIPIGEVEITDAYDLRKNGFHYIIHTVSPVYDGGKGESDELLKSCYCKALELAYKKDCSSVVFPLLSTGILNYPFEKARHIAEAMCNMFLAYYDMDITLVLYNSEPELTEIEREELDQYIWENCYSNLTNEDLKQAEHEFGSLPENREEFQVLLAMRKQMARKRADEKAYRDFRSKESRVTRNKKRKDSLVLGYIMTGDLDEYMNQDSKPSFNQVFERFRELHNAGSYADICRKANLREDTLSKLRKETWSHFQRDYLWALAVALRLNLEETEELFNSCGCSIKGGYKYQKGEEERERALEFSIMHGYDIKKINNELEMRGMLKLGNFIH